MNKSERQSDWILKWDNRAYRDLKKLPQEVQHRIYKKISEVLPENPFAGEKLGGIYKGYFRLRIGDYRVVYQLLKDEVVIMVLRIGDRSNIYKLPL